MGAISRREFLEDSLLAAAAAAAGPIPRPALPGPKAGPNDRLRVAVLGVHGQGRVHVNKWADMKDVEVAAICDPDSKVFPEAAAAVERKGGRKPQYVADLRKLFEDSSIDAVSIAAPNHWHALASIWAIQSGKDVYVEKPLCHSLWEGRKLVEASRKYGKIVQMGNYTRSLGNFRSAIEFLKTGKLGRIKLARGICFNKRESIGKKPDAPVPEGVNYDLWQGPAPERPFNPNRFHYNWHWNWDYGGGEMANNGIYYLDIARWGLGKTGHPSRIMSVGGRLGYEDDGQTPNTQIALYDYGDVEIIQEIRGLPSEKYMDVQNGNVFHCEQGYLASGKGVAAFDRNGELIERFTGTGDHFRNFVEAVKARNREMLNSEVQDGHLSTALCHLGNISYRVGAPRPLSQDDPFGKSEAANESFRRFRDHLKENGVDPSKTNIQVGRELAFDGAREVFPDDPTASGLLKRTYRKPFVVPDPV
jgi:predicted dehydrogenase